MSEKLKLEPCPFCKQEIEFRQQFDNLRSSYLFVFRLHHMSGRKCFMEGQDIAYHRDLGVRYLIDSWNSCSELERLRDIFKAGSKKKFKRVPFIRIDVLAYMISPIIEPKPIIEHLLIITRPPSSDPGGEG